MAYPTDNTASTIVPGQLPLTQRGEGVEAPIKAGWSDSEILDLHKRWKKESFEKRWVWERNWMRNIHYTNNRHWITYIPKDNQWRDVKLAKWVPKPVTPLIWEGVQALRAMFAAVEIGANIRPNTADPESVAVAAYCDELHPVLHNEHDMEMVFDEFDYWFLVTGWACVHTYLDHDVKYGTIELAYEQCVDCEEVTTEDKIAEAGQMCPTCGSASGFTPVANATTGETHKVIPKTRGRTDALSPFEVVFNNSHARFEDVPYIYRLRWRAKSYYTNHPVLKTVVGNRKWSKAPSEQSLQLFRSLPYHTDSGLAPVFSQASDSNEEGDVEYECWVRPCDAYPKGLVFRVLGDKDPLVLHLEDVEGIPGVLPYTDVEGNPIFTFAASPFESRGGRVYGSSPLDAAIPIMNQINQIDSTNQLIFGRMGNPIWLIPKGAGIQKFSGEPGWIAEWNPLTVGGNAKPERMDGMSIPSSAFTLRDQKVNDLEEALGTYDVLKGDRPPNVNAFSAMQLLVERAQSRFASSFKGRGRVYRAWLKFALEIERQFGEKQRRVPMLSPAGTWIERVFENAQLQGAFEVVVEDGSMQPKTALGMRAGVEHLNTLGLFNPKDPDQAYSALRLFGMTKLAPTLNIHMQAALRKQQAFEQWAMDDEAQQMAALQGQAAMGEYEQRLGQMQAGPEQIDPATGQDIAPQPQLPAPPSPTQFTPLAWKPWYDPSIHLQQFDKWANSDKIVDLLGKRPQLEGLLVIHRQEIDMALQQRLMALEPPSSKGGPQAQGPAGAAQGMKNSNSESGGSQNASDHTRRPQEGV